MSPLTVFLGKLIGIYCIIAALALMAKSNARSMDVGFRHCNMP